MQYRNEVVYGIFNNFKTLIVVHKAMLLCQLRLPCQLHVRSFLVEKRVIDTEESTSCPRTPTYFHFLSARTRP